jgi:hypothetical protein
MYQARGAGAGSAGQLPERDFGPLQVFNPALDGNWINVPAPEGGQTFSVDIDPALEVPLIARAPLRRKEDASSQLAIFCDKHGRLHRLDFEAGVMVTFS